MQTAFAIGFALIVSAAAASTLHAQDLIKRTCSTDAYGTTTCTEHFRSGVLKTKTSRIMGISARKYERGVKRGKCMPSPSGACGGG